MIAHWMSASAGMERMIETHCWASKADWLAEKHGINSIEHLDAVCNPGFCLLESGHDGPHKWVPDNEIIIEVVK